MLVEKLAKLEQTLSERLDHLVQVARVEQERLLTLAQVAERLQMSPRGVRDSMNRGELPSGVLIGASRRWVWREIEAFLTARNGKRRKSRRGRRA
jgi:predicted DNA-binding transcriptional regulator AlpA